MSLHQLLLLLLHSIPAAAAAALLSLQLGEAAVLLDLGVKQCAAEQLNKVSFRVYAELVLQVLLQSIRPSSGNLGCWLLLPLLTLLLLLLLLCCSACSTSVPTAESGTHTLELLLPLLGLQHSPQLP